MKAYLTKQYGADMDMQATKMPEPTLDENEVLVEIHASSINPLDIKIKNGDFKRLLKYELPLVLGHDFSGIVKRIGTKVQGFKIGDEVYARADNYHIGTFAEFIAINEKYLALKPKNISMEEAASIPLVGLTAWQALIELGNLQKGQKVFIQSGSGGVGSLAIQLAKSLGAEVATTTSTENIAWVKSLGADLVIDYTKADFSNNLYDYDLVLHTLESTSIEKSLKILKPSGQLISLSGPPDQAFADALKLPKWMKLVFWLLSYRIRKKARLRNITFSFLFMRPDSEQLQQISALIDANAIRPIIDRTFPFDSINEAMAYVANGHSKGKVVIRVK